jgi:hypothetical protein
MIDKPINAARPPDDLDALLDRCMAAYTPVEPRVGFEHRVRARLADAVDSPQSRAWFSMRLIWTATAVFAAAALLLVLFRPHARPTPANLTVAHDGSQTGPSVPTATIMSSVEGAASSQPSRRSPANPTIKQRPIPHFAQTQPTQQQLIAQLMANGPNAIAALAWSNDELDKPIGIQPLPDDPLVIEPIKIAPIDDNPAEPGGRF